MQVTLTDAELALVRHELEKSLEVLRTEIRHTHESDLREELRHRESVLHGVLVKLAT